MNFKIISQLIYSILISLFVTSLTICGTDFAAIGIPKLLQGKFTNMQNYIVKRLQHNFNFDASPASNLHITLKEIADLNHNERNLVRAKFKKISKKTTKHDIGHAIKLGQLKIKSNGLVILKLSKSNWLTELALKIEHALEKLKKQNKLTDLFSRMDFPNHGHITLGYIKYKNKPLAKDKKSKEMINKIQKKFKNQFNSSFTVDRFVLLKSNAPAIPRVYTNKGTFYLEYLKKQKEIETLGPKIYILMDGQIFSNLSLSLTRLANISK